MDPATAFKAIADNWYWCLVGLYVAEKIVKATPTKYDDIVFDMIITPAFGKIKELLGRK
jgi:hypothetical protein